MGKSMSRDPFPDALSDWRAILSPEYARTDPDLLQRYTANVSGLHRTIRASLHPNSTAQVQALVQVASRHRIPLYPLSCGKNWGYGSRLPVRDGAVLVDLSRMNRIRNEDEITVTDHYAIIEPGVTQGDLVAALKKRSLPLLLNATAAGSDTSILGNSLDRGFGYFAMRPDDIAGMEVVLGNGEILRTGYGHFENATLTHHYKYGLGPSLDGLFFQSNYGIVTSASIHLHPRRQKHLTLIARLHREEDFPRLLQSLASLRRESVIDSVVHIGSGKRVGITLGPLIYNFMVSHGETPGPELRNATIQMLAREKFASWTAIGGVSGTADEVRARIKETRKRLGTFCTVGTVTAENIRRAEWIYKLLGRAGMRKRAMLEGAKSLVDFCTGTPSNGALLSPRWAIGELPGVGAADLDDSKVGLLFCCPALPLEGEKARKEIARAEAVFGRFGFQPYITLNLINTKVLLCVLNLVFDRTDPDRTAQAHCCVDTLFEEWAKVGIYPYRLGVQSMEQFVHPSDPFWKIAANLKRTFDPNHIIAPGRYNLV